MRRLIMASVATLGLLGAGLLPAPPAQAMPAAGGLGVRTDNAVEQVRLVCPRAYWNGFAWVRPPCYQTAPVFVAPPVYVGPPVVVRRPWRRRVYVY